MSTSMKPSTTEMTQIKSDENVGPSFLERQLQADAAKRAAQVLKKSSDTHPPQRPEDLPPVPEHSDGEINQLSTWSLLDDESSDDLHEPDHQTTVSDRRRPPKLPPKRQPESMTDTTSSHRSHESRDIEDDIKDLKKDRRLLAQENKEQAQEIRDLKKKCVQLQEIAREHFENNDSHRHESSKIRELREKFYEHVEYQEDHIAHLKQELGKRRHLIESMTIQTREANEEKASAEDGVKRLQRQVRDLNENLTECKDDLLRLQPPSQVPDSEVSDLYATLSQHISRWADDATEEEDLVATRFDDLLKADEVPGLLGKYLTRDHLKLAKKYPDCQPHLVQLVIHRYIEDNILSPDLYVFGLDTNNITLLKEIERGMESLEPPRDSLTRSRWRSETLKSLCAVPSFLEEQRRVSLACSKSLFSALASHLLPTTDTPQSKDSTTTTSSTNTEGWKSLHEQVTKPAVKLANILRLSTVRYTLAMRPRTSSQNDRDHRATIIHFAAVHRATLIDIATQKQLKPDSVIKVQEDGRIGEEMLMVHPSLVREGGGSANGPSSGSGSSGNGNGGEGRDEGRMVLCKPTVLIKLDEPMGKRNRGMRVLESITSSWFGGGGGGSAGGSGGGAGGSTGDSSTTTSTSTATAMAGGGHAGSGSGGSGGGGAHTVGGEGQGGR